MLMLLSQMKIGQRGNILAVRGSYLIGQRLLEMGLIPGTCVEVVRFAPLGDPMDIKIRGYHLSLRLKEAENFEVVIKE